MLLLPCYPISNEVIPDIYVPIPFANLLSTIIIHFGGALIILIDYVVLDLVSLIL